MDGASDDNSHYGILSRPVFGFVFFPTDLTGIDLARLADLPSDVLVEGRRVTEHLAALQSSHEEALVLDNDFVLDLESIKYKNYKLPVSLKPQIT